MWPWWNETTTEFWRACGFKRKPQWQTVYSNFVRLEQHEDAFAECVARMVQHAVKKSDGLVGFDMHFDSTEAETNARLIHDCRPGDGCKQAFGWNKNRYTGKSARAVSAEETTGRVQAERHRLTADEVSEDEAELMLGDPENKLEWNEETRTLRIKVGKLGCWFRVLDTEAGVRAYSKNGKATRFWLGYYNMKAIDHYTGAPVAVHVTSASIQEYHAYPELFAKATSATGKMPRAVVADRGFSVESIFRHNTEHGVASVIPYRKVPHEEGRPSTLAFDEDGIPRCKGCRGETKLVRFNESNPEPRIWFRCLAPEQGNAACAKEQSIYCKEGWRQLLPLWRNTEAYWALRDSHDEYERVHIHWRQRYTVAGDNFSNRPKRRGRACQQLRANAALIIEWLRILWREGWLGSARRTSGAEVVRTAVTQLGKRLQRRMDRGLHMPYGAAMIAALNGKPPPGAEPEPPPGASGSPAADGASPKQAPIDPDDLPF
jgi:hypothetical protein